MPTWSEILIEIGGTQPGQKGQSPHDVVRKKYLTALYQKTRRNTICYATRFLQPAGVPPDLISITNEDLQGLMEVIHGLRGPNLDLILHSPGGSPEAAEALVDYLRSKFKHIRVIVPLLAQSAATMMACAADTIVMGKHSYLGPTDPQIRVASAQQFVPAHSILGQFDKAVKECQDPKKLAAWIPILSAYGPHLLVVCENAIELSHELVALWLGKFMFNGQRDGQAKAEQIARWLADHKHFKSHGRPINRTRLKQRGLRIEFMERDNVFQDLVLSVFHATAISLDQTGAVKIIENHAGRAFIKAQRQPIVMSGQPLPFSFPIGIPSNPQQPPSQPKPVKGP